MDSLKYNHNYLEYLSEKFSKKVLQILQEQFINKTGIELTTEDKEKLVAEIIKNQFKLVDELEEKQKKLGDNFIAFFMTEEIMELYACYYLGELFKLKDITYITSLALASAWAVNSLTETVDQELENLERKKQ